MEYYLKAIKNYATFGGRAGLKEYWMFVLFNVIFSFGIGFIGGLLSLPILGTIYALATLLPSVAAGVRRMHDVGKSGWYLLIPLYNLILACQNGVIGENEYGPDPQELLTP